MTTFADIAPQLDALAIEVPSWAYGNSGTRFKVFGTPGTPRTVEADGVVVLGEPFVFNAENIGDFDF